MTGETKRQGPNVFSEIVKTFVALIEQKDEYLRAHAEQVAAGCVQFARHLTLPKQLVDRMYLAGLLHDIGRVCLPDELVHEQDTVTEEQDERIKSLPLTAENVLSSMSIFQGLLGAVRHQREAFDGSGYPDGLKGDDIPLEARILHLIDRYYTMTAPGPQQTPLSRDEALDKIQKGSGALFDERLVKLFYEIMHSGEDETGEASPAEPDDHHRKKAPQTIAEAVRLIIDKFKEAETDLPVLPKILQEIEKVYRKPNSNIDDLSAVIERDAAISVRLISIANSAVYRGTDKISTVRQAVPRMGMQEARNAISAIANKSLYKTRHAECMILMERLWLHALACAYASRSLAEKVGLGEPDKYFLMGLVHDIGKVVFVKALSDMLPPGQLKADDIIKGIQELHPGFGGMLLEHWGFIPEYVKTASGHEGVKFTEKAQKATLVVSLANMLTRAIGYSTFPDETIDLAGLDAARLLGIDSDRLTEVKDDVMDLMQKTASIF